jgi:hypothetical protein
MAELKLEPGDVVLVASDGFVAWGIRRFRDSQGRPTYVNHVAMVVNGVKKLTDDVQADTERFLREHRVDSRLWSEAILMDAQPPRVARRALSAYKGQLIAVYRPRLSYETRVRLARRAGEYDGKLYGMGKILLHLAGLSGLSFIDRFPICSWTVGVPYQHEGQSFGLDASKAKPDHIWDFVREHKRFWTCVRPLQILE